MNHPLSVRQSRSTSSYIVLTHNHKERTSEGQACKAFSIQNTDLDASLDIASFQEHQFAQQIPVQSPNIQCLSGKVRYLYLKTKDKITNLQLTTMQLSFIQKQSILNSLDFHKLNISKTFGLTILICQNSDPVYSPAGLKMLLHLLGCACIVHLYLEREKLAYRLTESTGLRNRHTY